MRLLRVIIVLVILALAGLAGYAYLGDMRSAPAEMRVPVQLDLNAAQGAAPSASDPATSEANSEDSATAPAAGETAPAPQTPSGESSLD